VLFQFAIRGLIAVSKRFQGFMIVYVVACCVIE
jgi:hypothetical protein